MMPVFADLSSGALPNSEPGIDKVACITDPTRNRLDTLAPRHKGVGPPNSEFRRRPICAPAQSKESKELSTMSDSELEEIESEEEDQNADLPSYEIFTYPADFTLEGLVQKLAAEEIVVPSFQRGFVWNRVQASRLIDSFLRGLPVPAIFLFTESDSGKLLIVDGQQRLKSISYFFEGLFGPEQHSRRIVFRLTGLEENSPYADMTYEDLRDQRPSDYARLNNSVLRSFVMRQLTPEDDTSIYHVFERLNTGGTQLSPQEIRNCVHHGEFNELLHEINSDPTWRLIFGNKNAQQRQRDIELILRFLALREMRKSYAKPMKKFLNDFMATAANWRWDRLELLGETFLETTAKVYEHLGERPFHIRAGLNAAVFDSVYVAVSEKLDALPSDLKNRYLSLKDDENYLSRVTSGTTDIPSVLNRIELAEQYLHA